MNYSILKTSVGNIKIVADEDIVLKVEFSDQTKEFPNKTSEQAKKQLEEYFLGTRRGFDLNLKMQGTKSQIDFYKKLIDVPYGTSMTYAEISKKVFGTENKARVVGNYLSKNNHLIIIPCHRIVAKNDVGGFKEGKRIKEKLLKLESVYI